MSKIFKIISGGQTGADRAALEAAQFLGIKTGGYSPKGFLTETGPDFYHSKFKLKQTASNDFAKRTILNIKHSDGTVVFSKSENLEKYGKGTKLTILTAKKFKKPLIINPAKIQFLKWLNQNKINILNVAGSRLSENKKIYSAVFGFLLSALENKKYDKHYINFKESIHFVSADIHSGSKTLFTDIAVSAIRYLGKSNMNDEAVLSEVKKAFDIFQYGRFKEMQIIPNFIKSFNKYVKYNNGKKNLRRLSTNYINSFIRSVNNESINSVRKAVRGIKLSGKKVMLISNSSAVTLFFKEICRKNIKAEIIQCKSLPGAEGKLQAEILKSMGFSLKLINDYDIRKYASEADLALLGCDAYNGKYFINKKGTYEIVKEFRKLNKPVYVIAVKSKYLRNLSNRKPVNGLFEVVPVSYVTNIFIG